MTPAEMREHYKLRGLTEAELDRDPLRQCRAWLEAAARAPLLEPTAAALATVSIQGKPSSRMVLVRGIDERGLVFYTNYHSRKGRELAACPCAALVLFWVELDRQVRVEGSVERVSAAESDAYFRGRPRESQLAAWASPQSEVIADRAILDERMKELAAQYLDKDVPRPPHWGGFRLDGEVFEFWQGRPNRLHDRFRYRRLESGAWQVERLAP